MAATRTLNDVPAKWRTRAEIVPGKVAPKLAERTASELRREARLAHLDGRNAQAKKFGRYAAVLERTAR